MQGITLITPTGARPEAFALCERWMLNQEWSGGEMQWLVVDDGPEPTCCTLGQIVIRPQPLWCEGVNTQARNLLAALPLVKHDMVLVIEDDDFYGRRYLELTVSRLRLAYAVGKHLAVGERCTKYYHIPSHRYKVMTNNTHGSLFQTAMWAEALPVFVEACESGHKMLDRVFFNRLRDRAQMFDPVNVSCGIKGLPGRPGIGCGHRPAGSWSDDPMLDTLRSWVGTVGVEAYLPWL